MEQLKTLYKCEHCQKSGESLSLYSANHKEIGWIKVCRECWTNFYANNRMVAGTGSSSSKSLGSSPCSSCPGCRF